MTSAAECDILKRETTLLSVSEGTIAFIAVHVETFKHEFSVRLNMFKRKIEMFGIPWLNI